LRPFASKTDGFPGRAFGAPAVGLAAPGCPGLAPFGAVGLKLALGSTLIWTVSLIPFSYGLSLTERPSIMYSFANSKVLLLVSYSKSSCFMNEYLIVLNNCFF
jgi:hypothetical protein